MFYTVDGNVYWFKYLHGCDSGTYLSYVSVLGRQNVYLFLV